MNLKKMFRERTISHEENPCGRWTFGNVIVATDGNENNQADEKEQARPHRPYLRLN